MIQLLETRITVFVDFKDGPFGRSSVYVVLDFCLEDFPNVALHEPNATKGGREIDGGQETIKPPPASAGVKPDAFFL